MCRVSFLFFLLILVSVPPVLAEDPVNFADPQLKAAVEESLWISDPTPTDMLGLTYLSCSRDEVGDLTGLEYATNLQVLSLSHNQISNISALSGLGNLRNLNLNNNEISDFSALSSLIALESLDIHHNQPSSISFLSGLVNLRDLTLRHNRIRDISSLSGLSNLRRLDVFDNEIADISALVELTSLEYIDVENNPLNEEAYCNHLRAIFEGNSRVNINYDPNPSSPGSVTASDGVYRDKVQVTWAEACDDPDYARYYRVYRARSADGAKAPISPWQTSPCFGDFTAEPGVEYTYWVQRATSNHGLNATDYSGSDSGWRSREPALTISSTPGGSVTLPGQGTFAYRKGEVVEIKAVPLDPNLYLFAGWTGTAVKALSVADPSQAYTEVTVDGNYTLRAEFLTILDTVHVDDNAPEDPGSGGPQMSDPQENGTAAHPFDSIQEAIDVAGEGACVLVRPGTYRESIDLRGKSLRLVGADPDDPNGADYPVLDGDGKGSVVRFTGGEDSTCTLTGFVITGGQDSQAGAILCSAGSLTVSHCLIVGNRTADPDGATIYCAGSDALFRNCTIADNYSGAEGAGFHIADSNVAVVNSIIRNNGGGVTLFEGAGLLSIRYSDIEEQWPGLDNLDADPLFVRRGSWVNRYAHHQVLAPDDLNAVWIEGDYHLKSQAGCWAPETQNWVVDETTSPCIDSGDPLDSVANEPIPNGGIINLGAYGGTAEASKSY